MKTAIAALDSVFERVDGRAKALGLSRSEFFSLAALRYLELLDREDLTARIDAAVIADSTAAADEQAEWARAGLSALAAGTPGDSWRGLTARIERGEIYWVDLGSPTGSAPAKTRPTLRKG